MRNLGQPCDGCYSGRPARWRIDYDCMGLCWVCKMRTHTPLWFNRVIDRFDRKGLTPTVPPAGTNS